jgi:ABC-type branched-subunit amino acid transport system ATPase component
MMKPDLLILDELTPGLRPRRLEQISAGAERLRQTTEITARLGEQNVTFALPHADRASTCMASDATCGRATRAASRPKPARNICKAFSRSSAISS